MHLAVVPSPPGVEPTALFDSTQEQTPSGLKDRQFFLDSMCGGACPFFVGGVICLVISANKRDLSLLRGVR